MDAILAHDFKARIVGTVGADGGDPADFLTDRLGDTWLIRCHLHSLLAVKTLAYRTAAGLCSFWAEVEGTCYDDGPDPAAYVTAQLLGDYTIPGGRPLIVSHVQIDEMTAVREDY